jgi:RNA ligase (TIGR02306 family)
VERKLASIQRVLEIVGIENADAIELVRINGWQCVTKKRDFAVGDLGVFFEIDSVPPDTVVFRFLLQPKPKTDALGQVPPPEPIVKPEKFRIRTMRLRGTLSHGLFMPLSTFGLTDVTECDNVTERLNVGKYEPPAPQGMGDYRGPFPGKSIRTTQQRIYGLVLCGFRCS